MLASGGKGHLQKLKPPLLPLLPESEGLTTIPLTRHFNPAQDGFLPLPKVKCNIIFQVCPTCLPQCSHCTKKCLDPLLQICCVWTLLAGRADFLEWRARLWLHTSHTDSNVVLIYFLPNIFCITLAITPFTPLRSSALLHKCVTIKRLVQIN